MFVDGVEYDGETSMVTIGNANQWGNHAKITPKASIIDGELDVAFVKPFHIWKIPYLAILLMKGTLFNSPNVAYYRGKKIRVEFQGEQISHYDGELFRANNSLEIEVLPSSLKVITPR